MRRLALALPVALLHLAACASTGTGERAAVTLDDPPLERFADFDGARVRYLDHGAGHVALVFVHGWASDSRVWRAQHRRFGDVHRNLYVDLIGHGGSDVPQLAYTMADMARSVAAVMDDAGVERALLVGHSNGTPVSREFYRLFPERTRALVAVDGSFRPMFDDSDTLEMMIAVIRGPEYAQAVDSMMHSMLSAELYEELTPMAVGTDHGVMVKTLEATLVPDVWTPDPIEVPLLAIHAFSPWWTEAYERFVRELAPGVDYRTFEGVGHFVQLEAPERFNAALDEFVERL